MSGFPVITPAEIQEAQTSFVAALQDVSVTLRTILRGFDIYILTNRKLGFITDEKRRLAVARACVNIAWRIEDFETATVVNTSASNPKIEYGLLLDIEYDVFRPNLWHAFWDEYARSGLPADSPKDMIERDLLFVGTSITIAACLTNEEIARGIIYRHQLLRNPTWVGDQKVRRIAAQISRTIPAFSLYGFRASSVVSLKPAPSGVDHAPRLHTLDKYTIDESDTVKRSVFEAFLEGKRFAAKRLNLNAVTITFIAELATAKAITRLTGETHLVTLRDFGLYNKKLYAIYDMYKCNLWTRLGQDQKVPLERAKTYIRDVCTGLDRLHNELGIVHRDIKPENILVDEDDRLTICDFDSSLPLDHHKERDLQENRQSLWYRAPEVVEGEPYSFAIDMWSVGTILAHFATGAPPFKCETAEELRALHAQALLNNIPGLGVYGDHGDSLLRGLLVRKGRLTARDVLRHPFLAA